MRENETVCPFGVFPLLYGISWVTLRLRVVWLDHPLSSLHVYEARVFGSFCVFFSKARTAKHQAH